MAAPAGAVLLASPDGTTNTDDPRNEASCFGASPEFFCDFPFWERVLELNVPNNACSHVYLGNGWIASADHSPCNDPQSELRFVETGAVVEFVPGTFVEVVDFELYVARVQPAAGEPPLPDLPFLPLADTPAPLGTEVVAIGRGQSRGAAKPFPACGWTTESPFVTRWGTNEVRSGPAGQLRTQLDCDCLFPSLPTTYESGAVNGDSGGPTFARTGDPQVEGGWELSGVIWGASQPGDCGSLTVAIDISAQRETIESLAGLGVDTDGDGIEDASDNCTTVANSEQIDTDGDGFGNACDSDVDQNGLTGSSDLGVWLTCLSAPETGPPADPTCEESDFDENGVIGASDFGIVFSSFGEEPGPSGLACADPLATEPVCP